MNFSESILIAFDSVRSNKLRSFLTLLSVMIGVFAIIGAGTLTRSVEDTVTKEVNSIGDATAIIGKFPAIPAGRDWQTYAKRKNITYKQYQKLKNTLKEAEYITSFTQTNGNVVKSSYDNSDPDVTLVGCDENGILGLSRDIQAGRNIINEDLVFRRNVAIIGKDIVTKVFKNNDPLGKSIIVGNQTYQIVGILKPKGATMGQSNDNMVLVPINLYLDYHSNSRQSLTIMVHAKDKKSYDKVVQEAINKFRIIRNLKPWQSNDFEIESSSTIADTFSSFTSYLTYFGIICGVISLIAAGIGIMNIMLMSVKERTREIGVRKALGARKSWILYQFIIETITLCQIGAIAGIISGLGGAFILTNMMNMSLSFPIGWIIFAIVVCTLLGVVSGAYPAWKAANLDPIEALRYE